jgi:hypothetical protein
MKKSCILFACTILTEQRTFVLYEFLKVIKDKFYDFLFLINRIEISY